VSLIFPDQQPIARIVGRRKQAPAGVPLTGATRAALDSLAKNRLTRAPKGVFRYATHDDMQRDRERWQVQAIVDTQRSRA
jgi:hypothetical protein